MLIHVLYPLLPIGTVNVPFVLTFRNVLPCIVGAVMAREITEVKPLQLANVLSPIIVTPLPIVTLVKPLQPWKALLSMIVTELGIVTEVKLSQYTKAFGPIVVTEFGIIVALHPATIVFAVVLIMPLQLSLES